MEKTDGLITTEEQWFKVEQTLFTYSEEEKEENNLNKLNANLILRPQFLTLDFAMLHSGYSRVETALYGFIKYFLYNNDKFYCTNEQLAEMLCVSENTITNAVAKLKKDWLINLTYKIKSSGWKIRFIRLTKSVVPTPKICGSETQNLWDIYNKIIDNKIINKENKQKKWYWEFGLCYLTDSEYEKVISDYWLKNWEHLIKEVDNYCARKWKKYKNYAAAIRQFADSAGIKKIQKQTVNESWVYDLPF